MKNITKLISVFTLVILLGNSALKAQGCTVVLKPNVLTDNLFVDQISLFSAAVNACNSAGNIQQIVIKYHNSFYNGNSPALKNVQVFIKQADNSLITLTPAQITTDKGAVIAGPAQCYTVTLSFTGNLPRYIPNDQYIEVKAFNDSGNTTVILSNWMDEVDVVTAP